VISLLRMPILLPQPNIQKSKIYPLVSSLLLPVLIAGCGTQTKANSTTANSASRPTLTTSLPLACSLVSKAQVAAALNVPVNSQSAQGSGNHSQCSWTYSASSLVTGLGSSATIRIQPPISSTPTQYYNSLKAEASPLGFHSIRIDNIAALEGFGSANPEVLVDTGSALITVASISTISSKIDASASISIATDAVEKLCAEVSCVK